MQSTKKLTNHFLLKKYFSISFLGLVIGVSIWYFLTYSEQQDAANYNFSYGILSALSGILVAFTIYSNTKFLNKVLPWQIQTGNRLLLGLLLDFIIAYLLTFLLLFLYHQIIDSNEIFLETYTSILIKLGIILCILTIIFEVVYFALYSYYYYSRFQIETVRQERKQIELQLNALKSQLSPHFLFNSLNTISSLIFKDKTKAESFIRKLASMYDFTLKSYHRKLITVKEELEFVNAYIFLIQTRFQEKINFNISVDSDLLSSKIPPLTLQMLVENAVKHNTLSTETPLEISISSLDSHLIVKNTITNTPHKVTSFQIGLKNINERYLLLVNKAISIIKSKDFTVKLPIIK